MVGFEVPAVCGVVLTGEGSDLIPADVLQSIGNSGSDILASVSSVLGTVVPAALGIMALVMAITIGIRLFKKMTKTGATP